MNGHLRTFKPSALERKKGVIIHVPAVPKNPLDECIYDLLPVEIKLPEKPKQYQSIHAEEVRKEAVASLKVAASMGPSKVRVPPPVEYLRKGDGIVHLQKVPVTEKSKEKPRGAGQFHKNEKYARLAKPQSDYVERNKDECKETALRVQEKVKVDYRTKKDYGKTPEYLAKRKQEKIQEEAQAAAEAKEKRQRDEMIKRGIIPLPEEERQRLIAGLKANWESLNHEYMRLSLTVDTLPKINRKVGLERQLKHLEDQMSKLSYPKILINMQSYKA